MVDRLTLFWVVLIITLQEWLSTPFATEIMLSGFKVESLKAHWADTFKYSFQERQDVSDVPVPWLSQKALKGRLRDKVCVQPVFQLQWELLLDFWVKQHWNFYWILGIFPTVFPITLRVTFSLLTKSP